MKYIDQYQGMEVSFWDVFPLFREVMPFRKLYKEDRSQAKNKSSKTMWFCVLAKDIDSEFYTMDRSELEEVGFDMAGFDIHDYLKEKTANLDDLLLDFELFIDTPLSADVRALETKMQERALFIRKTPYTLDHIKYPMIPNPDDEDGELIPNTAVKPWNVKGTAIQLDKMVTDSKKLHEEIAIMRASLSSEKAEQGKGGKVDSFLEG